MSPVLNMPQQILLMSQVNVNRDLSIRTTLFHNDHIPIGSVVLLEDTVRDCVRFIFLDIASQRPTELGISNYFSCISYRKHEFKQQFYEINLPARIGGGKLFPTSKFRIEARTW